MCVCVCVCVCVPVCMCVCVCEELEDKDFMEVDRCLGGR